MRIWHINRETGVLRGEGVADPDPRDPDNWLVPAHAVVVAPPVFNANTHRARWTANAWVVEEIPPPPTAPQPTIDEVKAQLLVNIRALRPQVMNVLDGLQVDALTAGDTATAAAIFAAKQACRDMPALDVSAATTEAAVRAAYLAEWRRIALLVPAPVRTAFATVLA